jgi:hypothetical protein
MIGFVDDCRSEVVAVPDPRSAAYLELELSRIESGVHRLLEFISEPLNIESPPS